MAARRGGQLNTWLLLRGLTRDARHWGDFGERLQRGVGAERVLMPDLPGNGPRWREPSALCMQDCVGELRLRLREAGALPPYRVFALSLGAMVALSWAEQHPGELLGAVLVNTSVGAHSPAHHRLRPGAWATLLSLAAAPAESARWERVVLRLTTRCAAEPLEAERLLERWSRWRLARPVSRANALRQLVAAARFRAPVQAPPLPLLLLASLQDRLVDARCSARLAKAWNCPVVWHPSAGHDLPLDDPDWTVAAVADWLQGAQAARAPLENRQRAWLR